MSLIEAVSPGEGLRQGLHDCYRELCEVCDKLMDADLSDDVRKQALLLYTLLEYTLGMRVNLEFRQSPSMLRNMTFFEKIGVLSERGIDVRSDAWSGLVTFRNHEAHRANTNIAPLSVLAELMRRRDDGRAFGARERSGDGEEVQLESLKKTMHMVCFDGPS